MPQRALKKTKKKSCLALDLEKFETLSNLETKNAKLLMIKTWKRNATLAKGKKQDLLKELRKWKTTTNLRVRSTKEYLDLG